MIIIVEGIDRVGKSTLCNRLESIGFSKLNGKLVCENAKIRNDIERDRITAQTDLLKIIHNNNDIVIDRFHISQMVYSIMEREVDVHMSNIDEELSKLNCKIVFVNPTDIETSSKQHGKDLTMYQKLFDIFKIMTKIPYYECNYDTMDNMVEIIARLKNVH
jgi:thymidylate kinase